MEISTLNHLLRSVRESVTDRTIIVFGSSSLFASFPNVDPELLGIAVTLDADFFIDPDDLSVRETLESHFGEDHAFHAATGHYGDFVDLRLSESFPEGWRDRLVPVRGFDNVFALEPVDMAVTKVCATARSRLWRRLGKGGVDRGRKDINTLIALLRGGRINLETLQARLHRMDYEPALTVECGQVMNQIIAELA
jgi:hypothetical protein